MQNKIINYPAEIIVVRHGESTQNVHARQKMALPKLVDGCYTLFGTPGAYGITLLIDAWRGKKTYSGVPDDEVILTHTGINQAKLTGELFWKNHFFPKAIIASSSRRARQTAELLRTELFDYTGKTLPLSCYDFLKEKREGIFDGYPRNYLKHIWPAEASRYNKESKYFYRAEGGENVQDVYARVAANFWGALQPDAGKSVMIVAHGITNLCIHSLVTGEDLQTITNHNWHVMPNLAITRYVLNSDGQLQADPNYIKRTIF